MKHSRKWWSCLGLTSVILTLAAVSPTLGQDEEPPKFPPLEKVTKGYTEVTPPNGEQGFYRLWYREEDQQLLAELPKDYAKQNHFIALTVSSGEVFAGLQVTDFYVHWRRFDKSLALVVDNLDIRSTGDDESKDSVERLFTDRIMLDVPIVTMVPRGGPVIDLDALLVRNGDRFFGNTARAQRPHLFQVTRKKVFSENVEVAVEYPSADGIMRSFHYSFSLLRDNPKYKKRVADTRVGYFTTSYTDYGKYTRDDVRTRYINRWHLEKRDPSLKLSPPKKPIVFYLEHTTPVRYRRWVRQGVLYWNKAFEKIGIVNAIEVREQDKTTGAHMDKDPEDVRYNFIRWLNNGISTAIGPSRVNPNTGEILDADIVLTDGWIRAFEHSYSKEMPKIAMEGYAPETLAWLAEHPNWDPRIRMAPPALREQVRKDILHAAEQANFGLAPRTTQLGDESLDGLLNRTSQVNGGCLAAEGRSYDVAMMRMMVALYMMDEDENKEGEEEEDKEQMLDGMPESFIGPLLADLVCHEVGHTLGLRHNFKASGIYTLDQINSDEIKGKKPFTGSVMDYNPVNFRVESGKQQGDWTMIGVGPYDMWAIEYGYELDEKRLPEILKRVAEPELIFGTDEDTSGPDPLARRYDFSKNPLDYATEQMNLVNHHRGQLLDQYVQDGDSWAKAREGYQMTFSSQSRAVSMMANWIGGVNINRDKKGDPNGRDPVEVIAADTQRAALEFVINHSLFDEAYGLSPELINKMSYDKWIDDGMGAMTTHATWPIHDRIIGFQASVLTSLMNPTVLSQVYDNEYRVAADEDALTLAELMDKIRAAVWQELEADALAQGDDRNPSISSLRRNLQTEHLQRLIDLSNQTKSSVAALKPISNLASMMLTNLGTEINSALDEQSDKIDTYSRAHLLDAKKRIERWENSQMTISLK